MATRQSSAGGPVHCHLQIARQRDLAGIFRAALDAQSRHTGVQLNILLGDRGIGFFVLDPRLRWISASGWWTWPPRSSGGDHRKRGPTHRCLAQGPSSPGV